MNLVGSVRNFILVSHYKSFRVAFWICISVVYFFISHIIVHPFLIVNNQNSIWLIAQSLLIERIFQWHPFWTMITTFYLIMGIVCFVPILCIWLLYTKQKKYIFYIFAALLLNVFVISIHFAYCRYSWRKTLLHEFRTIPTKIFYQKCGAPLYYGKKTDRGLEAYYTDGYLKRIVYIHKDGTSVIGMHLGEDWMD